MNQLQGHGRPMFTDVSRERRLAQRLARLVLPHRRATLAQAAEKVNAGTDRKESKHTEHHSLVCIELRSSKPARVAMLTPEAPTMGT